MLIGISFIICSLFYMILLCVVYFAKKRIKTTETEIYAKLLLLNLFGLILELLCCFTVMNMDTMPIVNAVVNRAYLIYFATFVTLFTVYIYVVCCKIGEVEKNELIKFNKVEKVSFIVAYLLLLLSMIVLPIEYCNEVDAVYSYGLVTDVLSFVCGIYMLFDFVIIVLNEKKLNKKKLIPIIALLICFVVAYIIRHINPGVILTTCSFAFVTAIMYFTIENPDVKMVGQLEVAREQADKANRAKTDFLSSMSHEIRTPLNAIVGFSDCIMDAKDLGEAKENARDIVSASQTLLEIVNGILDISKIEAGKIEIVNSKYKGREAFVELAKLITPKMHEKGLDFTYTIAEDVPDTLYGDHANLKKIVTNLLSNACKYTDKGFVHYEVNCVNSNGISKLIISVEDSGRGIKKENIDKMFTKFQRLDEDRNTTIEGTGLGLAITKQLIELMGGKIIVHTVYGEGSKFTVVLNQRIEVPDEETQKKVKSTLDLKDVRILMVDDTPLNLKVTTKLLEKYNANHIVTCNSGFECLEKIQRGEVYDIILLDDMMPKMSGVETFKKLREIPGFNIPTIALTANAITGMREKYLADGFNDYLAKPIEKDELIRVANEVLGRSATEEINVNDIKKNVSNVQVRDNIIVDDSRDKVIPVNDDIEEELGKTLDITSRDIKPIDINSISEISTMPTIEVSTEVESLEDIDNTTSTISNSKYDRKYLEDNGVDVNHALELFGDMEMYNMTINDFMAEVEDKWNRICEYKANSDMENYAIEVHSLKSDCKYLGFMTLADIAYQHELKSKEKDVTFVNNNFLPLEEEYKKVLEIAKNYVKDNPTSE